MPRSNRRAESVHEARLRLARLAACAPRRHRFARQRAGPDSLRPPVFLVEQTRWRQQRCGLGGCGATSVALRSAAARGRARSALRELTSSPLSERSVAARVGLGPRVASTARESTRRGDRHRRAPRPPRAQRCKSNSSQWRCAPRNSAKSHKKRPPGGAAFSCKQGQVLLQSNTGESTPSTLCSFGLVVVYCRWTRLSGKM